MLIYVLTEPELINKYGSYLSRTKKLNLLLNKNIYSVYHNARYILRRYSGLILKPDKETNYYYRIHLGIYIPKWAIKTIKK